MRRVFVNDPDIHGDPSPLLPGDGFTVAIEEAAVMRRREFGDDFQQPFSRKVRRLHIEPGLRERSGQAGIHRARM